MRGHLLAFCMLLTLTSFSACRGDSWAAPSPRVFASEDGETALKIVPDRAEGRKATASATSFRLNPDGSEQVLNRFPLVNTPMRVLIPEREVNFFVTLDTYANLGFDHTLVIYRSNGQVVRDLKLEDFFTAKDITEHVKHSVSSRRWREGATFMFEVPSTQTEENEGDHKVTFVKTEPENAKLHISLPWGKKIIIKLATGEVLP